MRPKPTNTTEMWLIKSDEVAEATDETEFAEWAAPGEGNNLVALSS